MANISFNPALTTSPQNSFLLQTQGYAQGSYFDDPTTRGWLKSGQLASTVAQPVWGGLPITAKVNAVNSNQLGNQLDLATSIITITGWVVTNQANNMIVVPGNNVQIAVANQTVNYFDGATYSVAAGNFVGGGSNARIAVACNPTLVSALASNSVDQNVSWDFVNNYLTAYSTGVALPVKVLSVNNNSKLVSYNSGTGAVTWTTGPVAIIQV